MVFGLGGPSLKGCNAVVTLSKVDYYAGEVLQGQLTLNVTTPVECQGFTIVLTGEEVLKWQVTTSSSDPTPSDSNLPATSSTTTSDYAVKHSIISQSMSLLHPVLEVTPPAAPVITTGKHIYPFAFQLPPTLPSSHQTAPTNAGAMENVISMITYSISASIHLKGGKNPKAVATRGLSVHALPVPPAMCQGRAAMDTRATRVNYLCCFSKGNCELTLSTDRDTVDVNAGSLPLNASVKNETSLAIKALVVSLKQDMHVHIPNGPHKTRTSAPAKAIFSKSIPEQIPAHTTKDGILMALLMTQVNAVFGFAKSAIVPSCDLRFVSFRYRVAIKVMFQGKFLTSTKADLPITLLNIPKIVIVPVIPVPPPLVGVPADNTPLPAAEAAATDDTAFEIAPTDATSVSVSVAEPVASLN